MSIEPESEVSPACWAQVMACLDAIWAQDRFAVEIEWAAARGYGDATWMVYGGLLGRVLQRVSDGRTWEEQGVGALAKECWESTRAWLGVSEASFFHVLTVLTVSGEYYSVAPEDGYIYLVIAAVIMRRISDPIGTIVRTKAELVRR
jgi:hypothetical protein